MQRFSVGNRFVHPSKYKPFALLHWMLEIFTSQRDLNCFKRKYLFTDIMNNKTRCCYCFFMITNLDFNNVSQSVNTAITHLFNKSQVNQIQNHHAGLNFGQCWIRRLRNVYTRLNGWVATIALDDRELWPGIPVVRVSSHRRGWCNLKYMFVSSGVIKVAVFLTNSAAFVLECHCWQCWWVHFR